MWVENDHPCQHHIRQRWGGRGRTAATVLLLSLTAIALGCARPVDDDLSITLPPTATIPSTEEAAPAPSDGSAPVAVDPDTSGLRIEPAVLNLAVGESLPVQVWFDNPEGVTGIEIYLSFDPGFIHVEDSAPEIDGVQVEPGSVPNPEQVIQREVNNETGVILYQVAQETGAPARTSGCVARFNVQAVAQGESPMRFTIVNVSGANGGALETPGQVDGLVIVGAGSADAQPAQPPAATQPTSIPAAGGQVQHTVQAGENLFRIALHYGTTVEAIVEANQLTDASAIRVGQVLVIPGVTPG
ncbi:MAG: LysM peptidoglycan-binding domain-containing protein, partial [Anaerolineales bacterium]|nr:LysM peptidoglycan-binding domain-containing protein [Anaerolineales bacterium]